MDDEGDHFESVDNTHNLKDDASRWYWMCHIANLVSAQERAITDDDVSRCVAMTRVQHEAAFWRTHDYVPFVMGDLILPLEVMDSDGPRTVNTCVRFFRLTRRETTELARFARHLRRVSRGGVRMNERKHRIRFFHNAE